MKTYTPKIASISHDWYLVDASGQTLGRLASTLAHYLQGKHKPGYAPHLDGGDIIVVVNAANLVVTGNKLEDKRYYHHSGFPGGISEVVLKDKMATDPAWVIRRAVAGMLPKNRLADDRLARLKIYALGEHPHAGQQPKVLEITGKGRAH